MYIRMFQAHIEFETSLEIVVRGEHDERIRGKEEPGLYIYILSFVFTSNQFVLCLSLFVKIDRCRQTRNHVKKFQCRISL